MKNKIPSLAERKEMLWNYSRKFFKKKGKDLHKYVSPLQEFTFTCQNILRFGQEEHPEGGWEKYR